MPLSSDSQPDDWEGERRKLAFVRDQARMACAALRAEREKYKQYVARTTIELNAARAEIAAGREQAAVERERLLRLYQRLKQRTHRHCLAQRQALRDREQELEAWERELQHLAQTLQAEKDELFRARAGFNSEQEIARRRLQIGWNKLKAARRRWREDQTRERAELEKRNRELTARCAEYDSLEGDLAEQRRNWSDRLRSLQAEAEGLENRIGHQRRKLEEQETELRRLAAEKQRLQTPPLVSVALAPQPADVTEQLEARELALRQGRQVVSQRLGLLEQLADDLDDQRSQLTRQADRLRQDQQRWEETRAAVTAKLESMAERLQQREQAVEAADRQQRERQQVLDHWHKQLQAQQAQYEVRRTEWESERERLLAELRSRKQVERAPALPPNPEHDRLQWKVLCLQAQRETFERQIRILNQEVERLAHALIDEDAPILSFPSARAA
jgi:chromosome segregation ATPase